jgi:hypothetical protein
VDIVRLGCFGRRRFGRIRREVMLLNACRLRDASLRVGGADEMRPPLHRRYGVISKMMP